ncbi:DnaJ subfamily C member 1 [Amphibalanus amphitrite]|uniref:DnaJ subfamily C member 1 n=1 Tax=Amphibalanus amphitrite TaxID=1232801 RepID=A0A6A4WUB7_AMPAM|nr:DnaJ subfamily C member 1 [Amphibalanus amphitrite]
MFHDRWEEEAVRTKFKRERKQGTDIDFDVLVDQYMTEVKSPSWWNTLPFQTLRTARWLVVSAPFELVDRARSQCRLREQRRLDAEKRARQLQEERDELQRQRDKKRELKERRRQRLQELQQQVAPSVADRAVVSGAAVAARTWSTARSGPWTDEDLVELARLVKRHPGGTPERWELIAEALQRTVIEVTKMARIIRDKPHMVPVSSSAQTHTADGQHVDDRVLEVPADQPPAERRKVKTRAADNAEHCAWSQTQQKALEV